MSRKILYLLLFVGIILGGIYLYLHYGNTNKSQLSEKFVTASIVKILKNQIQLSTNQGTISVNINKQTKFTETFMNSGTLITETKDITKNDLKEGMLVTVSYQENKNKLTAFNINYFFDNYISGTFVFVNQEKIITDVITQIDKAPERFEVNLSPTTSFYKVVRNINQSKGDSEIEKMDKNILKENDKILIFFDEDVTNNLNQNAKKVIVITYE